MRAFFVYVTCPSEQAALELAERMVSSRLCACANVMPGMRSLYWWQRAVQTAEESVLVLKTAEDRLQEATKRLCELHPYEVPCVVAWPIEVANPAFLDWIVAETRANAS